MTPVVRFAAIDAVLVDGGEERWLSDVEIARRDRLHHSGDRSAFSAAHVLVRRCVAELIGVPARTVTIVQHCDTCGRPHGRPSVAGFPEVHVSLSHTRGYVAAAAAWSAVGIDVEARRYLTPPRHTLTSTERAWLATHEEPHGKFLEIWVRKEALVKAGVGRLDRLDEVDALTPPAATELTSWSDDGAVGASAVMRSTPFHVS